MDTMTLLKMLERPTGCPDMVLDTDAYNEIDDQFAISYALRASDKMTVKALYAAPFHNSRSTSAADGMEKSYNEILTLLKLAGREDMLANTFRGSLTYLPDEKTPVDSNAARDLAERAKGYTSENPLYVVAIGAITNVASAILMAPEIVNNIVIVWLGGHAWHWTHNKEFNLHQDIAAARVIFGCGAPVVQLPCSGVVSEFRLSKPELEYWFKGKNPLADYLAQGAIDEADSYAKGKPWTRVIWDVTAIAWLTDRTNFLSSTIEHSPIPEYDGHFAHDANRHFMRYVRGINRDALMADLIRVICG
ncbi:MAG: nucleoside hydrolase [Clostridia bacterium]|nr:nucleoside hydrolase [Clostridia bacterium]